jgi:hypothetical protein
MKTKLFLLSSLLVVLVACGKKDDEAVVTTTAVAATPTCSNGQVWTQQYGCGNAQYGYPGCQPGNGAYYPPVQITIPQGSCGGPNYGQYPYGGGGYYCHNHGRYRWRWHGGMYYYYYM